MCTATSQVAIWQDGLVSQAGRFATTPEQVRAFVDSLGLNDEVALEATGKHVGNRDAAGQPGESDGGVQPGQTRGIAERPPADVWRRRMCTGSPRDGYGLVQSPTATVDSRSAASIDASGARRRLRRASAYCAILLNM